VKRITPFNSRLSNRTLWICRLWTEMGRVKSHTSVPSWIPFKKTQI